MRTRFPLGVYWSVVAAGAVLVVYLCVLAVMPKHVFWSPDEGGRFIQLQSLRWQDGVTHALAYPGAGMDPELRFFPAFRVYPIPAADGTVRFQWPVWFPLLSRALFIVFGITGIYLISLFSGWLSAVVCGVLSRRLAANLAPAVILLVGFTTPIFFYSLTFWEHTLAALLALLSVLAVVRADGRARAFLVAAPLLVMAAMVRLEIVAFAVALLPAVLISNLRAPRAIVEARVPSSSPLRQRLLLLAGLSLIVVLVAVWMQGLPTRHRSFITSGGPLWTQSDMARLQVLSKGLVEVVVNTSRNEGPDVYLRWSALTLAAVGLTIVAAFVRNVRLEAALLFPALLGILSFSTFLAFSSQPYRALHGIVPVAPYVVLAAYVLPQAWRGRQRLLLLLSILATLYFLSGVAAIMSIYVDSAGLVSTLEWGQRYILTLYPLLATLAVFAISAYWKSARPAKQRLAFALLAAALIAVGVVQQVRGLRMLHENRERIAVWDEAMRVDDPIVTDVWWLPSAVAEVFTTREVFVALDRAAFDRWLTQVRPLGVRRFTFASLKPLRDRNAWRQQRIHVLGAEIYPGGLYLTRFELRGDANSPQQEKHPRWPKR